MHPAVRDQHRRALRIAVELRGGPDHLPGMDEADAIATVIDHDWVYRQLVVYEYGGLATFLDRAAAPDLVVGADRIQDWARSPMRVLRYEARTEQTLTLTDLTSGDHVEVPNLGAAAMVVPGECALGRLVPTCDGPMFEGMPLTAARRRESSTVRKVLRFATWRLLPAVTCAITRPTCCVGSARAAWSR